MHRHQCLDKWCHFQQEDLPKWLQHRLIENLIWYCHEFFWMKIERNLLKKFKFSQRNVKKLINRILQVADLDEPTGTIKVIPHGHTDNLVLETALLGRAKYLVTGDKEHLLPLKVFRNIKILDPAQFLLILKN